MIVMPAWNEAENIKRMIEELVKREFPQIKADMQLLVVDNHSTDGTTEVVEKASKAYHHVHIIQQEKKGLGWAYVTGMKYAMKELAADAILEMDADFQHPPRFVKPMVDVYLTGADYCIGSRYVKGGSVPSRWAITRKAVSYFGNLFIRIVLLNFKIHDLTTGFRLARVKGVLDKIELEKLMDLDRFAYKVDLLYQCLKNSKKTVEVPLQFAPRASEKSKFSWIEFVQTLKVAIILGIKDKQRFLKFALVGFTGFVVNYIGLEVFRRLPITTSIGNYFRNLNLPAWLRIISEATFWATLFGTELAIISNFIFNNVWTFKEKKLTRAIDIIPKFLLFNLSSFFAVIVQPLIVGGAVLFLPDTSLTHFLALIFALVFVIVPYNYIVYNLFIWKTWKLPWQRK